MKHLLIFVFVLTASFKSMAQVTPAQTGAASFNYKKLDSTINLKPQDTRIVTKPVAMSMMFQQPLSAVNSKPAAFNIRGANTSIPSIHGTPIPPQIASPLTITNSNGSKFSVNSQGEFMGRK